MDLENKFLSVCYKMFGDILGKLNGIIPGVVSGGSKTRSSHKRSSSARKSYRRRVKSSPCRKKGPAVCRSLSSCKYVSGKKRSFCRKGKNTRRSKRGGRHH